MEKKTLIEFVMNFIENDKHLSQLKEKNPLLSLAFITFGVDILEAYKKALMEGIEFTVNMEED